MLTEKVQINQTDFVEEASVLKIGDEEIDIGSSFPQRRSRFELNGAFICEVAIIRKTILQDLTTVRLELVPSGQKFSVENIACTDKFVDEFDLINKTRMVRIAQTTEPGKRFILELANDTRTVMPVTTKHIVPSLRCNEVQIARLMPGKAIKLVLDTVSGCGAQHSTFAPVYTVYHREQQDLRGINQQERYYDVTRHELFIENDVGLDNEKLLHEAIEHIVTLLRPENVLQYKQLSTTGSTDLLYPQFGFHAGAVIHFLLLKQFPETSLTLTQDHPSEKGLIIKFVKPRDVEQIRAMLMEVSEIVRKRWG